MVLRFFAIDRIINLIGKKENRIRKSILCLIVSALVGSADARVYYNDGAVHDWVSHTSESFSIEDGTTINIGDGVTITLTREQTYASSYLGAYSDGSAYLNLIGSGRIDFAPEMAMVLGDSAAADGTVERILNMSGTSHMNPATLYVGMRSDCILNITDDAMIEVRTDGTFYTPAILFGNQYYNYYLTAIINQSGNSIIRSLGSGMNMGANNTGIYNMSGGLLELGGAITGPGADDQFNFSGGTIMMNGNHLPWSTHASRVDWFNVTGPYAGNYTETYADGKTTLQIIEGVTAVMTESGGFTEVQEGGATDSYEIELSEPPTADVTVTATPGDSEIDIGEGAGAPKTLTFSTSNWDTPQTITVTANNDTVYEGGPEGTPHITNIGHGAQQAGGGGEYDGASISAVNVSVIDDELTCGDWGYVPADFNQDCRVNLLDFAMLALRWLFESP